MENSENTFEMGKPNAESELVDLTCPGDPASDDTELPSAHLVAISLVEAVNQEGLTEHRPLRPQ